MGKFLWFLGGCAAGLLTAATIGYLNEEETAYIETPEGGPEPEEVKSAWVDEEAIYPETMTGDGDPESKIIISAT